jgi:hypothetical protein
MFALKAPSLVLLQRDLSSQEPSVQGAGTDSASALHFEPIFVDDGIMMAEGDYVMIHSHYSNPDGSAIVVVDIMRIKYGVFEEHWDVIQPEATKEESKSKLPMFGKSFPR